MESGGGCCEWMRATYFPIGTALFCDFLRYVFVSEERRGGGGGGEEEWEEEEEQAADYLGMRVTVHVQCHSQTADCFGGRMR